MGSFSFINMQETQNKKREKEIGLVSVTTTANNSVIFLKRSGRRNCDNIHNNKFVL